MLMFGLLDVLGLLLLFTLSLFFITLFHELGHALMVMIITEGPVQICIGSYGETNYSAKIKTGRLTTYIKYNPVKWRRGICLPPKKQISINHQILYIAAGPLMSLLSGLVAFYIFQLIDPGIIRFELMFFGFLSVFAGIVNLLPIILTKRDTSGQIVTSDGFKLKQLLRLKSLPAPFTTATELFNQKQFAESAKILETFIETGNKNKHILRLAIQSNLQAKNVQRSDELMTIFLKKHLPDSDIYGSAGYIKSILKDEESALKFYKKSLELNSGNIISLNNTGHSLIELGRFQEAVPYLEAAISESPKFCLAFCNLGLVKMHLGDPEAGLEAIQACLELDPNFADAHTCLGIYNLKKGQLPEAKQCFEKSKELGSDDLSNDVYLKQVEEMKEKNIM